MLDMDTESWVANIIAGVGLALSIIALGISWRLSTRQRNDSERVHDDQMLLSRRQTVFQLWEYLTTAPDLDPENPVYPDVLKVVNTLELVGLCWEGDITDKRLIRRTFMDRYITLYQEVEKVPASNGWKSGQAFLNENPAAMKLYDTLMDERKNRSAMG